MRRNFVLPATGGGRHDVPMDTVPTSADPAVDSLAEEAAAFDQRITERRQAGYVPDLRRAVKCDYFYKRFL